MLNKLFESNLRVKISNGYLLGPVTKYNKNYACKRISLFTIIRYFNLKIGKTLLL